jgi:tRNA G37 N-methylase Trm5
MMTLNDAEKIVHIWGRWEEFVYGRMKHIFMSGIPESLLPFPKDTLLEALNIMAEHYRNAGDKRGVKLIDESAFMIYHEFVDDEKALLETAKNINDPKWRGVIIAGIKQWQKSWITTQGDVDGFY